MAVWAQEALRWAGLQICWAVTIDGTAAKALERGGPKACFISRSHADPAGAEEAFLLLLPVPVPGDRRSLVTFGRSAKLGADGAVPFVPHKGRLVTG